MRPIRPGGIFALVALFVGAVTLVGACNTAGVSYVYMTIDSGGAQRRTVFYTDSNAIYCIARFSSARQDATLDFTILQAGVYDWCVQTPVYAEGASAGSLDRALRHPIFAVGEQTPGVGVETIVAAELLQNGIAVDVPCPSPPQGNCVPNLPAMDICSSATHEATKAGVCQPNYTNEGPDSCGPGLTCCQDENTTSTSTAGSSSPLTQVPYPAGEYTCVVTLDGVEAGSSDFSIQYPPPGPLGPSCPVPPPVNGIPCYDWVTRGSVCNGYDADSACTCTSAGTWSCTN